MVFFTDYGRQAWFLVRWAIGWIISGVLLGVFGSTLSADFITDFILRGHSITTWTRRWGRGPVESQPCDKGRYHVNFSQLSTRGGGWCQKWIKPGSCSWWMTPDQQFFCKDLTSVVRGILDDTIGNVYYSRSGRYFTRCFDTLVSRLNSQTSSR